MKKLILASISVLIFSICLFGQNTEISPCPSGLSVTGPSGLVAPGETAVFTADIQNKGYYLFEYEWTVNKGEITKGQGTSSITVENAGENLTATVELKVFSNDCETLISSETLATYCPPEPIQVDEISPPDSKELNQEFKDRLDNFAIALLNDPSAKGYILGYFGKNNSESSMKTELNKIADHLIKFRNFDASRLTFATAGSENGESVLQFWIVPAGAAPPIP